MFYACVQPNGQYLTYSRRRRNRHPVTEPAMTPSTYIYRACAASPGHRSSSGVMLTPGAWSSAREMLTAQPSSSTLNVSSAPSSRIRFNSKICQPKRVLTTTTGESNIVVVRIKAANGCIIIYSEDVHCLMSKENMKLGRLVQLEQICEVTGRNMTDSFDKHQRRFVFGTGSGLWLVVVFIND